MSRASFTQQRLLSLFMAGLLLFFSPLVLPFQAMGRWHSIPILLIYLFLAWAGVIAIAAWILSRARD